MRKAVQRMSAAAIATFTFVLCFVGVPHSAFAQDAEPLQTIISVHLDASTGDITVGSTVYKGANPGMHLLALSREPDSKHLDAPDLINDATVHDASAANQFLGDVLSNHPDAFLIVNAAGNYGFGLNAIAANLEKFGSAPDIETVTTAIPFVLLGNGGRSERQAEQRGYSTRNIDGYLATDSNGKYAFIQTDYVRYDMTTQDGTIKIGANTYTMPASSHCNGSNAFHLVVVNREDPSIMITNDSYCTAQSDSEITRFWTDLERQLGSEGSLFFIASNGHPIPANWDFYNCTNPPATCQGADGDRRIQRLANDIAKLGGYFETMVYLTPKDTYSLVGAPAPPAGTLQAANRARESSSVYPDHPTGELHGELARGRGNWYSPLDADPTGNANLDYYQILAQQPVPFPHPCQPVDNGCNPQEYLAERTAFQYISNALCKGCNVRNNYPNRSIEISNYLSLLSGMNDPNTNRACPLLNPASAFCIVRAQLLTEFQNVVNIRAFDDNLTTLWLGEGTVSISKLLQVSYTLLGNLPPPNQPTAPNLVEPIVSFFLGLASELPLPEPVSKLFGIADTAFYFASSLTTDENGDEQLLSYVETSSTLDKAIAALAGNADEQFKNQKKTTGTQFDIIYQDWGKINALGSDLASGSPGWVWDSGYTAQLLQAMSPAIEASYYQSLMPAVYAVGSYIPVCYLCLDYPNNVNWGHTPLWKQPRSYTVFDGDFGPPGSAHKAEPFNYPWYPPYTFPTDSANDAQKVSDPDYIQPTATLLTSGSWLAISWQKSPANSGPNGLYSPPDASILTHLFTPQSAGGLGVYRPAFFESWPFPRVKCGWSDNGSGDPGPGCDWGGAAPSPDAVPAPFTSVSIGRGISEEKLAGKDQIQVPLTIVNNGTLAIESIQIDEISLRTLAGSGDAVLADPLLPIKLGRLAPGNITTLNLVITLPPSVKQLVVTEGGTTSNNQGAPPAQFSFEQTVAHGKQQ